MADSPEVMVYNFSERLLDIAVHFHVMKMKDSLFIWIGKEPEFNSLSIAMCTKYVFNIVQDAEGSVFISHKWDYPWIRPPSLMEATMPTVTNLLGDISDITSNTMAQKFARKLKKQCFLSYNLPSENNLLTLVEKRLVNEIKNKPNKF